MFINYLKVIYRQLIRDKIYSFISISGLTLGLLCCLYTVTYLQHEFTFDRYHQHYDRIVRVVYDNYLNLGPFATSPLPVGPALKESFPEIEEMTRVSHGLKSLVRSGQQKYFEELAFVDPGLLDVFSVPIVAGNADHLLELPNTIMISETYARKYFGNTNPIGKTLEIGTSGGLNSEITAVFQDLPSNSSIQFDIALPFSTFEKVWGPATLWQQMPANYTFLLLNQAAKLSALKAKIPDFVQLHLEDQLDSWQTQYKINLQPLNDVHLNDQYGKDKNQGNLKSLYILGCIGFLILLIATVNYINYATARFGKRAKEMGVRKVIGADRRSLVSFSILETTVLSALAGILALVLVNPLLPVLNEISGKSFSATYIYHWQSILIIFLLIGCLGIAAGILPALLLSSLKPVHALYGRINNLFSGVKLRKVLITAQFVASLFLISATIIVYQQIQFIRKNIHSDEKNQIAVFQINSRIDQQFRALKEELLRIPGINSVSAGSNVPTFTGDSWPLQRDLNSPKVQTENFSIQSDFIETMNYRIIAGRDLNADISADVKNGFIINETAVRDLGFQSVESAIGQSLIFGNKKNGEIVGVVEDFNFKSFHEKIAPAVIQFKPFDWMDNDFVVINFQPHFFSGMHEKISEIITAIDPSWYTDIKFFNEQFMMTHIEDLQRARLLTFFAVLSVLISCMGLLGLISFAVERKRKEISIRKVLGAQVFSVFLLLLNDFLKLVLLAFLITTPVAWILMHYWLQDFAYQVSIQWWVFLLSGLIGALLAVLTMSYHGIGAALKNPSDNLRNE